MNRRGLMRWALAVLGVLALGCGVFGWRQSPPASTPIATAERIAELREVIADPDTAAPTRSAAELALRLFEHTSSEFEFFKTASAYTALTFRSGDPEKLDGFDRELPRIDQSIALRTGRCDLRDLSLRRLGMLLGKPDHAMRLAGLLRVPIQRNHSATEIELDGLGFVFFDPSFGVYFTDPASRPLSLAAARWAFPDIVMHYVDMDQGRARTHGADLPLDRIVWRTVTGRDLMAARMPCWYLGPKSRKPRKNCDVLRTYFASDVTRDREIVYRPLMFNAGDTLRLAETEHYLAGLVGRRGDLESDFGLRVLIPAGAERVTLRIDGQGLERFLVDYDDYDARFFSRGFDFLGIESALADGGRQRTLRFNTGGKGGVLSLIPTALGDARVDTIERIQETDP